MKARPLAALALCTTLGVPAAARADVRFVTVAGFRAPSTPARYDKVGILQVGPRRARNVLVLNPGTSAGSAYFLPLARSVVAQARGWQVWSVERRENLLEDQSVIDRAKTHGATAKQVFDYYVGWLKDQSIRPHFQPVADAQVPFARGWGLNVEIQDLRRVVRRAQRLGGRVVLGGHSLGGAITTAYATWDFGGRAGARGLSGLVFIDGSSRPDPITADDARQRLAALDAGSPWLTVGGIPAPFGGLLVSLGALSVLTAPGEPSLAQGAGLLPAELVPPVPASNAGQFGFALDTATSPPSLALAQAHLGHLATSGDPRGWVDDGELTPLRRYAEIFSGWGVRGHDGAAWYHPVRLSLDAAAVADGRRNPAQAVLGVHATRGSSLPRGLRLLAFGAALGGRRVLDDTRARRTSRAAV